MRILTALAISLSATSALCQENRRDRLVGILESPPFHAQKEYSQFSFEGELLLEEATFPCITPANSQSLYTRNLCVLSSAIPKFGVQRNGWTQLLYPIAPEFSAKLKEQNLAFHQVRERAYELELRNIYRIKYMAKTMPNYLIYDDFWFHSWEITYCTSDSYVRPSSHNYFYFYVPTELSLEFSDLMEAEITDTCERPVS